MRNLLFGFIGIAIIFGLSNVAFAAGDLPEIVSWYKVIIKDGLAVDKKWIAVAGSLLTSVVLLLLGLNFKMSVENSGDDIAPVGRYTARTMIESILDFIYQMAKDSCGKNYRSYVALLATIFLFILISNLSGLVPGFPPTTESMSTNVAIGLIVFLVYNVAGLKEHKGGYVKHFLGPVAFIAPLFFCIELVSHASRPFSLGLRLMGNIYGDHLLLAVFTGLTYLVLPSILMFFGLLVAIVQSFVFTLLSSIYVSMAISHDH